MGGQRVTFDTSVPPPGPPSAFRDTGAVSRSILTRTEPKPKPNWQGIEKLKIVKFDGDESKYARFKVSFKAVYEGRNLELDQMALILENNLTGRPAEMIGKLLGNTIDEGSYDMMWGILDQRFGGKTVQDAYTIADFKNAAPMKNNSMRELERMFDILKLLKMYYEKNDPMSLKKPRSMLMQYAKEKINVGLAQRFVRFVDDKEKKANFNSLLEFVEKEYLIAQKTEREYKGTSRSDSHSVKKTMDSDDDEEGDPSYELRRDVPTQEKGIEIDDKFAFYFEEKKSGNRYSLVNTNKPKYGPGVSKHYGQKNHVTFAPNSSGRGAAETERPTSQYVDGQCSCCKEQHALSTCRKFKTLPFNQQSIIMRRDRICYHCLNGVHPTRDCKYKENVKCGINGCTYYHHPTLHRDAASVNFNGTQIEDEFMPPLPSAEELETLNNYKIARDGSISIQTLVCNILYGKNGKGANFKTVALIDSGSSLTCIDEDFAKQMQLKVLQVKPAVPLHLLDRVVQQEGTTSCVEMQLSSIDQTCTKNILAWTVKNLAKDTSVVNWAKHKENFPHLRGIKFPPLPDDPEIKIIIGVDNAPHCVYTERIHNPEKDDDPIAMRVPLGWTCIGKSSSNDPKEIFKHVVFAEPRQQFED
jgi:hypothetical protein